MFFHCTLMSRFIERIVRAWSAYVATDCDRHSPCRDCDAQVAAQAGIHVVLMDANLDLARQALTTIDTGLLKLVDKGKLTGSEHEAASARLEAADAPAALAGRELIIEAAPESEAVKREIFAAVAPHAKGILATNTSSISITKLAAATSRPHQVIGMHFMNPVPLMKLCEVIRGLATDEDTYQTTLGLARKLGKTEIPMPRAGYGVPAPGHEQVRCEYC